MISNNNCNFLPRGLLKGEAATICRKPFTMLVTTFTEDREQISYSINNHLLFARYIHETQHIEIFTASAALRVNKSLIYHLAMFYRSYVL